MCRQVHVWAVLLTLQILVLFSNYARAQQCTPPPGHVKWAHTLWDWPTASDLTGQNGHTLGYWQEADSIGNDLYAGQQGPPYPKIAPVHAILLHNPTEGFDDLGKLLVIGTDDRYLKIFDLNTRCEQKTIDIRTLSFPASDHQIFCSGHSFLPDGRVLISGGNWIETGCTNSVNPPCTADCNPVDVAWSSIFDPVDDSFTFAGYIPGDPLPYPTRYYPTSTTLPDGTVLVNNGLRWEDFDLDHCIDGNSSEQIRTKTWARFLSSNAPGDWAYSENLIGLNRTMPDYARLKVIPKGLFWDGEYGLANADTSMLWPWDAAGNPSSTGAIKRLRTFNPQNNNVWRMQNNTIILTLNPQDAGGKILMLCGGDLCNTNQHKGGIFIDYAAGNPTWAAIPDPPTPQGAASPPPRRYSNSVLLPNGKVLLVGGQMFATGATCLDTSQCGSPAGCPYTKILNCAIFDPGSNPATGTWAVADSIKKARMYHSEALLLPDGRVFLSGNQGEGGGPETGYTFEMFTPPSLITSSGTPAARPAITGCPTTISYSPSGSPPQTFDITVSLAGGSSIDKVMLMAPSAVTHANDMSQRRVILSHTTSGSTLTVTGPQTKFLAPPGDYMLIVIDQAGVWSVARWVRLNPPAGIVVSSGQTLQWSGTVDLSEDVLVLQGGTLEIAPGTTIRAAANTDNGWNKHLDGSGVEIIIQGRLLAIGNVGSPITFTSIGGTGAAGEWHGIRFMLEGCERDGYGYLGSFDPPSAIENATIRNSKFGVKNENYAAPTIKNVQFTNISSNNHIYLDRTDVFIPQGYWPSGICNVEDVDSFIVSPGEWLLLPKTNVVASNSIIQDSWVGASGKVDLIANGRLSALGSDAPGDSVYFRPETITPGGLISAGADWGGITLSTESSGSELHYSQVGWAANPIFLSYPNGTTIENSKIHHFADLGIWIQGSLADGVLINNCIVDRRGDSGSELHPHLGDTGIYVDQADETHIQGTQILLLGLDVSTGGVGIASRFGKTFCQSTAPDSRLFVVQDCHIEGPGRDVSVSSGVYYSGLRTDWVCGDVTRDVDIINTFFGGWKFAGIELFQTADVQLTCNKVDEVRNGVDIYRDSEPSASAMRFYKNQIKATKQPSGQASLFALRTNSNVLTKLGPDVYGSFGLNRLSVHQLQNKFIVESDTTSGSILNARNCYWYTYDGSTFTLADDHAIQARIQETPADQVDILNYKTANDPLDCDPGQSYHGPLVNAVDEAVQTSVHELEIPTVFSLGLPRPNPSKEEISLSLAVPRDRTGVYVLEVFDVRGIRIRRVRQDITLPGRYFLTWDGKSSDMRSAASGIYFVRIQGPPNFQTTRKVTLIRGK